MASVEGPGGGLGNSAIGRPRSAAPTFSTTELLEALPSAAVVLDRDGRFVIANHKWTKFCIDHDEFVVALRPGDDFLALCLDSRRPIESGLRAVLRGAAPCLSLHYPAGSADGDRWIRVEATPLGDGALVSYADVGDEYAHLGDWLAGGIEGVVELNPALEPVFVSAGWLARSDRELWTAPLDEHAVAELWDRLAGCLVDHETFSLALPGGESWFRIAVSPEVGTTGEVRRIVIMISDTTQQRSAIARAAAQSELDRVAALLHDTAVQRLYGTALELQRKAGDGTVDRGTLDDTIARLDRTISELRALGRHTVPVEAPVDAWATVIDDAGAALGFEPRVRSELSLDLVDPATVTHLLAVANEALSNVARHARATTCTVQLEERGDSLVLTVGDDGLGMPVERARSSGTRNISQRAEALGGRAMWSPGATGGTVLTWQVPMRRIAGQNADQGRTIL